ncbi:hypothetical protein SPARTY_57 [Hafnia phage vB_HalM_SPARTY]|nr:hypothetical protein SPARTY_57 [Hafnia phage vB_HalM_SPARTY]
MSKFKNPLLIPCLILSQMDVMQEANEIMELPKLSEQNDYLDYFIDPSKGIRYFMACMYGMTESILKDDKECFWKEFAKVMKSPATFDVPDSKTLNGLIDEAMRDFFDVAPQIIGDSPAKAFTETWFDSDSQPDSYITKAYAIERITPFLFAAIYWLTDTSESRSLSAYQEAVGQSDLLDKIYSIMETSKVSSLKYIQKKDKNHD